MNRRNAVSVLLALASIPFSSAAQQSRKVWRIGLLTASAAFELDAFKQAFRELGYIEGRDYVLELRFADGQLDRLPALAAELVRLKMDLIMATQAAPVRAVQKETTTIPIVMISAGDPVGSGIVTSLARPGGNVTGTSNSLTDIAPKHLDLLRDTVPKLVRIAVLMNPAYRSHNNALTITQELAPQVGVRILPIEAGSAQEIANGFSLMARQKAQAVIVVTDPIFYDRRQQIAELAVKSLLPCLGNGSGYADAGFLMAYGPDGFEFFRRAAVYVDKIFKGAKPADLPIEQPTKFELVVNLKTAKAIGVNIPQPILLRADRVIK